METKTEKIEVGDHIGKMLKNLRKASSISKTSVAEALGYKSTKIVTEIENGKKDLSIGMLYRLAHILKIHPVELIPTPEFSGDQKNLLKDFLFIIEDPVESDLYKCLEVTINLAASRKRAIKKIDHLFDKLGKIDDLEEIGN